MAGKVMIGYVCRYITYDGFRIASYVVGLGGETRGITRCQLNTEKRSCQPARTAGCLYCRSSACLYGPFYSLQGGKSWQLRADPTFGLANPPATDSWEKYQKDPDMKSITCHMKSSLRLKEFLLFDRYLVVTCNHDISLAWNADSFQ